MSSGCNSCKYLDEKSKKPGRTSGYLYLCKAHRQYVNASKDECNNYDEDLARNTADRNEIYKDGCDYNDDYNDCGCNSCYYLDISKKAPGKSSGALYYCSKKNTYVNGAKDQCENYKSGFMSSFDKNQIYSDGEHYSDDTSTSDNYLPILIFLLIAGIILMIFFR